MAAFAKSWRREYTAAQMVCEGYHLEHACDRTGAEREAIVFELRSLEAVVEKVEAEAAVPSALTLEDLRQLAFSAATEPSQAPSQGIRNVYQRSRMFGYMSWRAPTGNARAVVLLPHFCDQTAHLIWSHIICAA